MIKLVVFDFDSTLIDAETLDFLALKLKLGEDIAKITQRAMSGELDFFESLISRVALFKNIPHEKIKSLAHDLPIMEGAKELITYLKAKNIKIVVFSGGFSSCIKEKQDELGFDLYFANYFHTKNGLLSGKLGGELMFSDSKGLLLKKLKVLLNLKKDELCVVGDGANDISMFKEAKLCIAFNAKEALKPFATHIINKKDLALLKTIIN